MEWALIIIRLMPYVIELIKMVEKLFADAAKAGPKKKELVEMAVKSIISDKPDDIKDKTMAAVSGFIDATAAYLFPHPEQGGINP